MGRNFYHSFTKPAARGGSDRAIDVYRGTANRVAVCNFLGCAATAAATAIGSSSSAEGDTTASSERRFGRAAASTGQDPPKDRND